MSALQLANVNQESSSETLTAALLVATNKRRTPWGTLRAGLLLQIAYKTIPRDRASSSSQHYVALPSTPPSAAAQPPSRTTSTVSEHIIDVPHDSEREEDDREEQQQERQLHLNTIAKFVKEKDLSSLQKFGGVEQVASVLGSNLESGIDLGCETQAWSTSNGPVHAKGYFFFLVTAGSKLTVVLLFVSAGLSFFVEIKEQGPKSGWHDGVAIVAAVVLIVAFNSVADFRRARKEEKKLWERRNKLEVKVVRSGIPLVIAISKIVVGDIVHLRKGDRVPADGLFLEGEGLVLDEGLNSKIDENRNPFLFSGSKVIRGSGSMIVTSVGANTILGKVLSLKGLDPFAKTLLEIWIDKATNFIDDLALCVSVLIAIVVLIEVSSRKHGKNDGVMPELKGNFTTSSLMKVLQRIFTKPRGTISVLASCLTVLVIGFQHGMPFVITVSLTYWKEKFEKNGANARNLSACGTVGVITVICVNATGGLLCNEIEVNKFLIDDKDMLTDEASETHQVVLDALQQGIGVLSFVPEASVSPTDELLISWVGSRWGMNMELVGESFSILDYRKLSSNKEGRGVLIRKMGDEEKVLYCHWQGDAMTILGMCSRYYDCAGESHAMGNQKHKFELVIKDMETKGIRPIAFACIQTEVEEIREDGLHLLALVGLKYPCQEEMKLAVGNLKEEGVSIKLVSEDELSLARALACELGIHRPGSTDIELKGESFRSLDASDRMEIIDKLVVMGRSLPEDNLLLVQCLKDNGHIVAFFGGLTTSDTPALQEADVGICDCTCRTEMARDRSDIVILSKNSLVSILELSRFAYHNIRTFIQLQLTACMSGLLVPSVATIIRPESTITAVQLFWVNAIMCLQGGFMMVMKLQGLELIAGRPKKRTQPLITKTMWRNIIIQVLCQACVLLSFQFLGKFIPGVNNDIQQTMIFNSFTIIQVFNLFDAMNLRQKEVLLIVFVNPCFLLAVGTSMILQVLIVQFMESLAGCVKLNWLQWSLCILLAALSWALDDFVKFIADSLSILR